MSNKTSRGLPAELQTTTLTSTVEARDVVRDIAPDEVPMYAMLHGLLTEAAGNASLVKRATSVAKDVHAQHKANYQPQGAAAHKNATKRVKKSR